MCRGWPSGTSKVKILHTAALGKCSHLLNTWGFTSDLPTRAKFKPKCLKENTHYKEHAGDVCWGAGYSGSTPRPPEPTRRQQDAAAPSSAPLHFCTAGNRLHAGLRRKTHGRGKAECWVTTLVICTQDFRTPYLGIVSNCKLKKNQSLERECGLGHCLLAESRKAITEAAALPLQVPGEGDGWVIRPDSPST